MLQTSKKVIFISEGSNKIGIGHIIRCSALSIYFLQRKWETILITSKIDSETFKIIKNSYSKFYFDKINDYAFLKKIAQYSDLLVIDNYNYPIQNQIFAKEFIRTVIFDDYPHRQINCNYLIDPTLGRTPSEYYNFVNPESKILTGTKFVPLRKSFQKESVERNNFNYYKHLPILIYLGGSNNIDLIIKIIFILKQSKILNAINLICSKTEKNKIIKLGLSNEVNFFNSLNDKELNDLINKSSLAIGASGSSCWERCVMGLPSIVIPISQNQIDIATELVNHKAAVCITEQDIDKKLDNELCSLLFNEVNYINMSKNASLVCDGFGTKRLFEIISSVDSGKN